MKVVIYLRVSTNDQNAMNQLPALTGWIAQRGYELVDTYAENESAWKAGHQKELARLFADLPRRKVDVCLVWALDRLTREGISKIFQMVSRFKAFGVQVISYQESWTEQSGPMADLLYAIAAWVAEAEAKRLSERVKAGLARVRAEGKILGRPIGSRDKRIRKTRGYHLRFADQEQREKYG